MIKKLFPNKLLIQIHGKRDYIIELDTFMYTYTVLNIFSVILSSISQMI